VAHYEGDNEPNVFTGGSENDSANGWGGDDRLTGNGGNDSLAGFVGLDRLDGGEGDDRLFGLQWSPLPAYYGYADVSAILTRPFLDIGAEADTLLGGGGDDRLFAGYGDDVDGGDDGTAGDYLYIGFQGATAGIAFDFRLAEQTIGGGTIRNVENLGWLEGSNHADDIYAAGLDDSSSETTSVFGLDGDDIIRDSAGSFVVMDGGGGNDILYAHRQASGGEGHDRIELQPGFQAVAFGEAGNDDITANDSGASISGGAGADVLRGGAGHDLLVAGEFELLGLFAEYDRGSERDVVSGGDGYDVISIGYGDDADGGADTDQLWLSLAAKTSGAILDSAAIVSGQPFLLGGGTIRNMEGLLYLEGTAFADDITLATQPVRPTWTGEMTVDSGGGDDIVRAAASGVAMNGGDGDDVLVSGSGSDFFNGGAGTDRIDYGAYATAVAVTLTPPPASQSGLGPNWDVLISVENVAGSAHADSLTGDGGANMLAGRGGDDSLDGRGGSDLLDGGSGADSMTGGAGDDIYFVDEIGDSVIESSGGGTDEVRTGLASYSLAALANVENLKASSDVDHDFRGSVGNNVLTGGAGSDFLRLYDGGNDSAFGGAGNDVILFGGAMSWADFVDGGVGLDQLVLQGHYVGEAALLFGGGVVSVENIAILPGDDTRFGDPGTNFYDYSLTLQDATVASGIQLVIDANRLRAGEDFTFDGSGESDGSFFIYGGGGTDILFGGANNDVFLFGAWGQWNPADVVVGGSGIDQLALRGNYSLTFGAGQLFGIENIGLLSAHDTRFGALGSSYSYDLTMVDGNVASGVQMVVDGAKLRVAEFFRFDGLAELDGSFRVFGGLVDDTIIGSRNNDFLQGNGGSDTLTGGEGADMFRYLATSDSTAAAADRILDFTPGTDKIDLSRIDANSHAAGDQAFSWVGSNAFTGSGAASAGELRAYQSGQSWFVEGDTDGDGDADLLIDLLLAGPTPLGSGDFLL
jgi:Ca2+-binding RTX toxin-like protein